MTVAVRPNPLPRHMTPLGGTHRADVVARVAAALLGTPLLPWQYRAAQLIEQLDPVTGLRLHPFVLITVQRQSGKSQLVKALAVSRCMTERPGHRFYYTAQSGQAASEKWAEVAHQVCAPGTPLAGYVAARWTNGSQSLRFPNGSTFAPFAPTRDSLHGKQSDTCVIDEGFSFDPTRGQELLQAIGPSQATRPGAQVVIVSTQGDDRSTWLHQLIDRGRMGAPGMAYLEHGIGDDADPTDLDLVAAAHPAVGYTISREFLQRQALVLEPAEFARAYGNARTATAVRVIDPATWAAAATGQPLPAGRVTLAADLAQDRSRGAILAATGGVLEVIESREGIDWVAGRLLELRARHRPVSVAVLRDGPSGTLADDLITAGVQLYPLTASTYAVACARFLDDLRHGLVKYRLHPALDAAAAAAAQRRTGEGWVWSRRFATSPIPELVAATLASWADQHRPPEPPRPAVYSA